AIAGIGAGAYFLLNSQKAQAQEMPPAGIGSGYGGGAVLGTSGSPTTSVPVSSTGTQPVYNISFEAPAFESQNYGQAEPSYSKKDTTAQTYNTSTGTAGGSRSIKVGSYSGTATPLGDAGNQLVSFGENAQAVTLTKKQVAEQSAKSSGAPVVALAPVGNTVSDVVKAGNVASIFAQQVRDSGQVSTNTTAKKSSSEPVNTGWGNPIGMISSWIGSIFGGR
ncbi:MAG: hypothetical protein PHQ11_15865, partial [Paludibacter sp.]|nr:hypothetical protein [Paludibacter sp.]